MATIDATYGKKNTALESAGAPDNLAGDQCTRLNAAYPLGKAIDEPRLAAKLIDDKNGHILPYVTFEGGSLELSSETLQLLDSVSSEKRP